jgi:ABC-type siderophore export system fused ATPase/permease subunit
MHWLSIAIGTFVLSVFAQRVILRVTRLQNGMIAFVAAGLPLGLLLMAVLLHIYSASSAWAGIWLYAFLCELWIFVFSSTFSSVSANLLLQLRLQPMRREEIDQLCDSREMVRHRLSWLRYIQAAAERDGRLMPTERGRQLARLFDALRTFFGHR